MNREQRIAGVISAAHHVQELERLELRGDGVGFLFEGPALQHLGNEARVLLVRLGRPELEQRARVLDALAHGAVRLDPALERLRLLDDLGGPLLV